VPTETPTPSLAAVVLTRDEAHQIADCVATLRFAGRVLVLDSGSADGTPGRAAAAGALVETHPFVDYASQRNIGLAAAGTEWVLMIDADERVPPALAAEILAALRGAAAEPRLGAFRLVRRNFFLGEALDRYGGGRERIVRLVRARRTRFENAVHESAVVDGEIRDLATPFDHLTHVRLRDAFGKALRYALLWADDMHARGRRTSLGGIAVHTVHRFVKVFVLRRGFLEGTRGFLLAGYESVGVFYKYALLWERQRAAAAAPAAPGAAPDDGHD
jgi:glycosyltransferase involved in cell wall biosynthesis